jgi:uncharacterized protein YcgI (DUF1989 family)
MNDESTQRRRPVVVYDPARLPRPDLSRYATARAGARRVSRVRVAPRDARIVRLAAGDFLRIVCPIGPQVGDLNLWHADDPSERFFSGKTRALHRTHVTTGDRLWSSFPALRPLMTIVQDTLADYGFDADGAGIHDVIGTRCDPYTQRLLNNADYDRCCHSNLTRALATYLGCPPEVAEPHVHDALNVFMCTGFTRDTGQYFMKASPVRAGDYLELFAEIDLLAGLSACPGGDCGAEHSSDAAPCFPLDMEVYRPDPKLLGDWVPSVPAAYGGRHGMV